MVIRAVGYSQPGMVARCEALRKTFRLLRRIDGTDGPSGSSRGGAFIDPGIVKVLRNSIHELDCDDQILKTS